MEAPTPRLTTRFTDLVGCALPIQLAGLGGGIGTPDLASAVAAAGGLGLVGHTYSAERLASVLEDPGHGSPGALGVNFLVPFLDPALVDVAAPRVRVVDFFYGDPERELVARAQRLGALVSWQVGSVEEARRAVGAGCDLVVAQGIEAGGHLRGDQPLRPLLRQILDAVDVPILAAGGIATAADVASLLGEGADGVRVGTRFVTALESGAHPDYVAALIAARGGDTLITTAFGLDWPDAPHRVLGSSVAAAGAGTDPGVAAYDRSHRSGEPIRRWSSRPPTRDVEGDVHAMALYAGAGVGAVTSREPAAAIVADLVADLAGPAGALDPAAAVNALTTDRPSRPLRRR